MKNSIFFFMGQQYFPPTIKAHYQSPWPRTIAKIHEHKILKIQKVTGSIEHNSTPPPPPRGPKKKEETTERNSNDTKLEQRASLA